MDLGHSGIYLKSISMGVIHLILSTLVHFLQTRVDLVGCSFHGAGSRSY